MERLLTLYSEVQSTDVRWLWYPFIAIGKITLLQGDPDDGKYVVFKFFSASQQSMRSIYPALV